MVATAEARFSSWPFSLSPGWGADRTRGEGPRARAATQRAGNPAVPDPALTDQLSDGPLGPLLQLLQFLGHISLEVPGAGRWEEAEAEG